MKLGKLPYRHDDRTVHLARYLDVKTVMPKIPRTPVLPPVSAWGMLRNDELGDCGPVAFLHQREAWTAWAGKPYVPTDDDATKLYEAVGGYVPGDASTDNGVVLLDLLNYERKAGTILAFAHVNTKDQTELRAACYLFGGLLAGYALPAATERQGVHWHMPAGSPLKAENRPGSWGGHAIYQAWPSHITSWGEEGNVTAAFQAFYGDEAWAIIPAADFFDAAGRTPEGFDLAALQADLRQVGVAA